MTFGKHLRRWVLAALIACMAPASALAYSQCAGKVQRIWIGDGGTVWIFLATGGPPAVIASNDLNREGALAGAMSAQATGRTVTLRFSADNVCSTTEARFDFVGMYLE